MINEDIKTKILNEGALYSDGTMNNNGTMLRVIAIYNSMRINLYTFCFFPDMQQQIECDELIDFIKYCKLRPI